MKTSRTVEYWVSYVDRGYLGRDENHQKDRLGARTRIEELRANDMVREAVLFKRVISDTIVVRSRRRQRDMKPRDL